jgi:hypothetical protein
VNEVQVDVVDAEQPEALLDRGDRVAVAGWNLVVMNTASRGKPLWRSALPTLSSFP